MLLTNKINATEQQLQGQAQSLSIFLQGIKEERQLHAAHRNLRYSDSHDPHASSQLYSQQNSELPPHTNKQIYSEGARSLYLLQTRKQHQVNEPIHHKYHGDSALKNRARMGHGNRFTLKQYQIPPHFFTPAKEELENHLRHSRVLPNLNKNEDNARSASQNYHKKQDDFGYSLLKEADYNALAQSKILTRGKSDQKNQKIYELNPEIALKYCLINKLTANTDAKQILVFFVRLLQILGYSIPEPKIQKYKDCIIFYKQNHKNTYQRSKDVLSDVGFSQGLIYFFNGSLYFGELYKNSMHGLGIRIFFRENSQYNDSPSIFKGQFRNGIMKGYFQVKKQGQRYSGDVENGVYHGYGKLTNNQGSVQGQFKNGRLVGGKFQPQKQSKNKHLPQRNANKLGQEIDNYHINKSMMNQNQHYLERRQAISHEKLSKKDMGTMIPLHRQSTAFYQSQMAFHPSQLHSPHKNFRVEQSFQQAQINPWSEPYQSKLYQTNGKAYKKRQDNSDLIQFSYPFGNDLSDQITNHTKNYRSRIRSNHLNPQQRQHQKEEMKYIGKISGRKPHYRDLNESSYVNESKYQRYDSSYGEQEPLEVKC